MPELPEVETVRSVLEPRLVGRKFINIEVLYERMIHSSIESLLLITNQEITSIERIGKYLIFKFANGYALLSHLRMEGKYYFYDNEEENSRFARVIFYLDNNQKVCYDDSRKFGVMKVIESSKIKEDKCHSVSSRFLFSASSMPDTKSSAVKKRFARVAPVSEPSIDLIVHVLNRPGRSRFIVVSLAFVPWTVAPGNISCHVYSTGSLRISRIPSYSDLVRMAECADDRLKSFGYHPPTSESAKISIVEL